MRELIEGYIAQANQQARAVGDDQAVRDPARELTVDEGEVTPSQKIRRRAVEKKYADRLDAMYDKD